MANEYTLSDYLSYVDQLEMIIIRDVRQFPMHTYRDFIVPHLVICVNHSGTFRALYDMKKIEFGPNEIAVVMPNHVMRPISCSDDYRVTLIVISGKFLDELKQRTLSHDHAKYHASPDCKLTDEQMSQVNKMIDAAEVVTQADSKQLPHRHTMLLYLADVGFELLNYVRKVQDVDYTEKREVALFNQFCDLLSMHYTQHHDANFYATQLHMSPQHFAKVINHAIGMSASAWIKQYLITQAKQILTTRPDINVQQVTYMLGFSEPAGFCRFFKIMTGMRPKEFRDSYVHPSGLQ